jgi:hypothetical protein
MCRLKSKLMVHIELIHWYCALCLKKNVTPVGLAEVQCATNEVFLFPGHFLRKKNLDFPIYLNNRKNQKKIFGITHKIYSPNGVHQTKIIETETGGTLLKDRDDANISGLTKKGFDTMPVKWQGGHPEN